MSKQDVVVSKAAEVVTEAPKNVSIGGVVYEIANRVNLPTLSQKVGETIAIRVDANIRQETSYKEEEVMVDGVKRTVTKENIINVVRVTEMNSLQPFEYVCNAMTADNLRSAYPEDTYVGRVFAILKKDRAPGKQYMETEIVELQAK